MTKINKTDEEWQQELSKEQYQICRKKGTERAFTGQYCDNKKEGVYQCVCCGAELFDSSTKYDSGSGWPSFDRAASEQVIHYEEDGSLGMSRVEVSCDHCGSHLGHGFDDGPSDSTGKRYCVNSLSLDFSGPNDGSDDGHDNE